MKEEKIDLKTSLFGLVKELNKGNCDDNQLDFFRSEIELSHKQYGVDCSSIIEEIELYLEYRTPLNTSSVLREIDYLLEFEL